MNAQPTATQETSLVDATWSLDSDDELFREPYVDIDEWRAAPAAHRYVHGGFRGTDTRFSFYFPAAEAYQGRFFQHVTPVPQSENLAQENLGEFNPIAFSVGQRRVLRRDQRRRSGCREPDVRRRPDDRRLSCQRGRRALLARGRRRDLRRAPPLRLPLRRQRRRVPHDRLVREHRGRLGRLRALRPRQPDGDAERLQRAHACAAHPPRQVPGDRRRLRRRGRPRGARADRRGARCARRGHAHGLPAAVVVRVAHHGHARVQRAVPGGHVHGPDLRRRLLDASTGTSAPTRRHRCTATASSSRRRSPS